VQGLPGLAAFIPAGPFQSSSSSSSSSASAPSCRIPVTSYRDCAAAESVLVSALGTLAGVGDEGGQGGDARGPDASPSPVPSSFTDSSPSILELVAESCESACAHVAEARLLATLLPPAELAELAGSAGVAAPAASVRFVRAAAEAAAGWLRLLTQLLRGADGDPELFAPALLRPVIAALEVAGGSGDEGGGSETTTSTSTSTSTSTARPLPLPTSFGEALSDLLLMLAGVRTTGLLPALARPFPDGEGGSGDSWPSARASPALLRALLPSLLAACRGACSTYASRSLRSALFILLAASFEVADADGACGHLPLILGSVENEAHAVLATTILERLFLDEARAHVVALAAAAAPAAGRHGPGGASTASALDESPSTDVVLHGPDAVLFEILRRVMDITSGDYCSGMELDDDDGAGEKKGALRPGRGSTERFYALPLETAAAAELRAGGAAHPRPRRAGPLRLVVRLPPLHPLCTKFLADCLGGARAQSACCRLALRLFGVGSRVRPKAARRYILAATAGQVSVPLHAIRQAVSNRLASMATRTIALVEDAIGRRDEAGAGGKGGGGGGGKASSGGGKAADLDASISLEEQTATEFPSLILELLARVPSHRLQRLYVVLGGFLRTGIASPSTPALGGSLGGLDLARTAAALLPHALNEAAAASPPTFAMPGRTSSSTTAAFSAASSLPPPVQALVLLAEAGKAVPVPPTAASRASRTLAFSGHLLQLALGLPTPIVGPGTGAAGEGSAGGTRPGAPRFPRAADLVSLILALCAGPTAAPVAPAATTVSATMTASSRPSSSSAAGVLVALAAAVSNAAADAVFRAAAAALDAALAARPQPQPLPKGLSAPSASSASSSSAASAYVVVCSKASAALSAVTTGVTRSFLGAIEGADTSVRAAVLSALACRLDAHADAASFGLLQLWLFERAAVPPIYFFVPRKPAGAPVGAMDAYALSGVNMVMGGGGSGGSRGGALGDAGAAAVGDVDSAPVLRMADLSAFLRGGAGGPDGTEGGAPYGVGAAGNGSSGYVPTPSVLAAFEDALEETYAPHGLAGAPATLRDLLRTLKLRQQRQKHQQSEDGDEEMGGGGGTSAQDSARAGASASSAAPATASAHLIAPLASILPHCALCSAPADEARAVWQEEPGSLQAVLRALDPSALLSGGGGTTTTVSDSSVPLPSAIHRDALRVLLSAAVDLLGEKTAKEKKAPAPSSSSRSSRLVVMDDDDEDEEEEDATAMDDDSDRDEGARAQRTAAARLALTVLVRHASAGGVDIVSRGAAEAASVLSPYARALRAALQALFAPAVPTAPRSDALAPPAAADLLVACAAYASRARQFGLTDAVVAATTAASAEWLTTWTLDSLPTPLVRFALEPDDDAPAASEPHLPRNDAAEHLFHTVRLLVWAAGVERKGSGQADDDFTVARRVTGLLAALQALALALDAGRPSGLPFDPPAWMHAQNGGGGSGGTAPGSSGISTLFPDVLVADTIPLASRPVTLADGLLLSGSSGSAAPSARLPPLVSPAPSIESQCSFLVAESLSASRRQYLSSFVLAAVEVWLVASGRVSASPQANPSVAHAIRVKESAAASLHELAASFGTTVLGLVWALSEEVLPRLAASLLDPDPAALFQEDGENGGEDDDEDEEDDDSDMARPGARRTAAHASLQPLVVPFVHDLCCGEVTVAAFLRAAVPVLLPSLCTTDGGHVPQLCLLAWYVRDVGEDVGTTVGGPRGGPASKGTAVAPAGKQPPPPSSSLSSTALTSTLAPAAAAAAASGAKRQRNLLEFQPAPQASSSSSTRPGDASLPPSAASGAPTALLVESPPFLDTLVAYRSLSEAARRKNLSRLLREHAHRVLSRALLRPMSPAHATLVSALLADHLDPALQANLATEYFDQIFLELTWHLGEASSDSPLNRAALALRQFAVLVQDGARVDASRLFKPVHVRKAALDLMEAYVRAGAATAGAGTTSGGGGGGGASSTAFSLLRPQAADGGAGSLVSPGRHGRGGSGSGAGPKGAGAAAASGSTGRLAALSPTTSSSTAHEEPFLATLRAMDLAQRVPDVVLFVPLSVSARYLLDLPRRLRFATADQRAAMGRDEVPRAREAARHLISPMELLLQRYFLLLLSKLSHLLNRPAGSTAVKLRALIVLQRVLVRVAGDSKLDKHVSSILALLKLALAQPALRVPAACVWLTFVTLLSDSALRQYLGTLALGLLPFMEAAAGGGSGAASSASPSTSTSPSSSSSAAASASSSASLSVGAAAGSAGPGAFGRHGGVGAALAELTSQRASRAATMSLAARRRVDSITGREKGATSAVGTSRSASIGLDSATAALVDAAYAPDAVAAATERFDVAVRADLASGAPHASSSSSSLSSSSAAGNALLDFRVDPFGVPILGSPLPKAAPAAPAVAAQLPAKRGKVAPAAQTAAAAMATFFGREDAGGFVAMSQGSLVPSAFGTDAGASLSLDGSILPLSPARAAAAGFLQIRSCRDVVVRLLRYLLVDKASVLRHSFSDVPSLQGLPGLEPFDALLQAELRAELRLDDGASIRPEQRLPKLLALLRNDIEDVQEAALREMFRYLSGPAYARALHSLVLDSSPDGAAPLIEDLVGGLLDLTRRSAAATVRQLCAACLGQLGAIDPSRLSVVTRHDAKQELGDRLFLVELVRKFLVTALRAAPDTPVQDKFAYAIQQLLKRYGEMLGVPHGGDAGAGGAASAASSSSSLSSSSSSTTTPANAGKGVKGVGAGTRAKSTSPLHAGGSTSIPLIIADDDDATMGHGGRRDSAVGGSGGGGAIVTTDSTGAVPLPPRLRDGLRHDIRILAEAAGTGTAGSGGGAVGATFYLDDDPGGPADREREELSALLDVVAPYWSSKLKLTLATSSAGRTTADSYAPVFSSVVHDLVAAGGTSGPTAAGGASHLLPAPPRASASKSADPFDAWIAGWTRFLLDSLCRAGSPRAGAWEALCAVVALHTPTALFVLPYLVRDALVLGPDALRKAVRAEVLAVLEGFDDEDDDGGDGGDMDEPGGGGGRGGKGGGVAVGGSGGGGSAAAGASSSSATPRALLHRATQATFALLDVLRRWTVHAEERKNGEAQSGPVEWGALAGPPANAASAGSSKGKVATPASPAFSPYPALVAFLDGIPLRCLADAAFRVHAHTRALLYLEQELRAKHGPPFGSARIPDKGRLLDGAFGGVIHGGIPYKRKDLAYVQLVYSHVDEPDGMVAIAVLRSQLLNATAAADGPGRASGGAAAASAGAASASAATTAGSGTASAAPAAERKEEDPAGLAEDGKEALLSLHERMIDYEHAARWNDALMCYEQALQALRNEELASPAGAAAASASSAGAAASDSPSSLNDSMQSDDSVVVLSGGAGGNGGGAAFSGPVGGARERPMSMLSEPILHAGLLRCLRNVGHLQTALNYAIGVLGRRPDLAPVVTPHAVEAAWRMGQWEPLDKLLAFSGGGGGGGGSAESGSSAGMGGEPGGVSAGGDGPAFPSGGDAPSSDAPVRFVDIALDYDTSLGSAMLNLHRTFEVATAPVEERARQLADARVEAAGGSRAPRHRGASGPRAGAALQDGKEEEEDDDEEDGEDGQYDGATTRSSALGLHPAAYELVAAVCKGAALGIAGGLVPGSPSSLITTAVAGSSAAAGASGNRRGGASAAESAPPSAAASRASLAPLPLVPTRASDSPALSSLLTLAPSFLHAAASRAKLLTVDGSSSSSAPASFLLPRTLLEGSGAAALTLASAAGALLPLPYSASILSLSGSSDPSGAHASRFDESIVTARREVMSSLSAASWESYTRAYPFLLKLHVIREVEMAMELVRLPDPAARAEVVRGWAWDARLRITTPSLALQEPLLALRRALYRMFDLKEFEAAGWLDLARAARAAGHPDTASFALLHAAQLGADVASLQKAKLLHSQGDTNRALLELEPVERDLDKVVKRILDVCDTTAKEGAAAATAAAAAASSSTGSGTGGGGGSSSSSSSSSPSGRSAAFAAAERVRILEAKRILHSTNWMVDSRLAGETALVKRYDAVTKLHPKWEKGHFFLGRYYDSILVSMRESIPAQDAPRRDPESLRSWIARRDNLLMWVIKCYATSLYFGHAHIFQSLPRLFTLYLDYGAACVAAQDAIDKQRKIHTRLAATSDTDILLAIQQPEQCVRTGFVYPFEGTLSSLKRYLERLRDFAIAGPRLFAGLPQLCSRICHRHADCYNYISSAMCTSLILFPQQASWVVMGLVMSGVQLRRQRAEQCLQILQNNLRDGSRPNIKHLVPVMRQLFEELIAVAQLQVEGTERTCAVKIMEKDRFAAARVLVPLQASLQAALPTSADRDGGDGLGGGSLSSSSSTSASSSSSSSSSPSHGHFGDAPSIVRFERQADVMASKERPKKIVAIASDGKRYAFLCKRESRGDLRKDARMMEFASVVNRMLAKDPEGRRRKLRLRTYAVVILNEESALMQWVNNTAGMRGEIGRCYSLCRLKPPTTIAKELRPVFDDIQTQQGTGALSSEAAAVRYRAEILPSFPAVFHRWFPWAFPDPTGWLEARTAFGRSGAVWSMVGHVIGLGDRHGENLLLDKTSGECVHVDFDCLFDKGMTLARPEIVPFRLTPSMLDALGIGGYEGVFRRVSEVTMGTLRAHKGVLLSVLEPFIHDPLVEWQRSKSSSSAAAAAGAGGGGTTAAAAAAAAVAANAGAGAAAASRAGDAIPDTAVGGESENTDGVRMVKRIAERLDGMYNAGTEQRRRAHKDRRALPLTALEVKGQVNRLLKEATDDANLALMWIGWMPFL
jgi:hypothetical protein